MFGDKHLRAQRRADTARWKRRAKRKTAEIVYGGSLVRRLAIGESRKDAVQEVAQRIYSKPFLCRCSHCVPKDKKPRETSHELLALAQEPLNDDELAMERMAAGIAKDLEKAVGIKVRPGKDGTIATGLADIIDRHAKPFWLSVTAGLSAKAA